MSMLTPLVLALVGAPPAPPPDLTETLVAIEEQAWAAWKTRNSDFYRQHLIPESVYLSSTGVSTRDETVAQVTQLPCTVHAYAIDQARVVPLNPETAVLTAHTTAQYTCNGKDFTAVDWISTVFVKRDGRWLIAFHQETKAAK